MVYVKITKHLSLLFQCLVGVLIVFTITFLTAYLSGEKKVTVEINTVGEAHIELFILIIIWIMLLHFVYTNIFDYLKVRTKEERIRQFH